MDGVTVLTRQTLAVMGALAACALAAVAGAAWALAAVLAARVLRVNASELCAVAALPRVAPANARGVALVERLLTDAGSALYGKDVWPLCQELRQARFLLQSRAGAADR